MIYVLIPTTPERNESLTRTIRSIKKSICDQPIQIRVDINNYEGAVKSLLRLFQVDGLALFLGDDTEVFPDTIQLLYDTYRKAFPEQDGMVASMNAHTKEVNLNHPFAHTQTFRDWTHAGYFHNFVDREWFELSQIKDRYAVSEAKIMHNHYTRNGSIADETYKLGEKTSDADGELFYKRRSNKFYL